MKVVEEYFKKIRRELFGIDSETSKAVIEEMRSHIQEKANDLAKKDGLKEPNVMIYKKVIESLGSPGDIIIDYLKVLPKKPTRWLKLFFIVQAMIGIISIVFGLDQVYYSYDIYILNFIDFEYFLGMISAGIVFIFIGFILLILIYIQYKYLHLIIQYGAFCTIISLTLGFGILLIMLDFFLWRYTSFDYTMDLYYAFLAPLLLVLVIIHLLGLQHTERIQRRFALEELDDPKFKKRTKKSKTVLTSVAIVTLVLISMIFFSMVGHEWVENDEKLFNTEQIGGRYDAKLELWHDYYDGMWNERYWIKYTKDGQEYEGYFPIENRASFDWIRNNTEQDTIIFNWWDYGHAIRGYSGRDIVLHSPSKALEDSIYDPSTIDYWEEDNEKVKDIASAYLMTNGLETVRLMEKYNATYIFTTARDRLDILYAFFMGAELNLDDYFESDEDYAWHPNEKGRETTIYKMWSGSNIEGLDLVYSDINTKIYKISD